MSTKGPPKRFVLFAGSTYYPGGGWADFVASFDSAEEARAHSLDHTYDWRQIVDLQTGEQEELH
jgi:hypothetical protein